MSSAELVCLDLAHICAAIARLHISIAAEQGVSRNPGSMKSLMAHIARNGKQPRSPRKGIRAVLTDTDI